MADNDFPAFLAADGVNEDLTTFSPPPDHWRSRLSALRKVAPHLAHKLESGWFERYSGESSIQLMGAGALVTTEALDILRRYIRLVVQEEGFDFLGRLGSRSNDVEFTADELALLAELSRSVNGR